MHGDEVVACLFKFQGRAVTKRAGLLHAAVYVDHRQGRDPIIIVMLIVTVIVVITVMFGTRQFKVHGGAERDFEILLQQSWATHKEKPGYTNAARMASASFSETPEARTVSYHFAT